MKKTILLFSLLILFSCSKDDDNKETLLTTSINPSTGPKNTPVTIIGSGFSNVSSENVVTINGKVCPVINSTSTQLTITIPPSAGSGKIKVTVATANAESSNFDLIATITARIIAGSTFGFNDGSASNAQFKNPAIIAVDTDGNLFVTDGSKIRKITSNGLVTTIAGTATNGFADGNANIAKFNRLDGITIDSQGNLYVADTNDFKIRKITFD
ncbi:IPT/TIG domain-containing protein [Flavobacterium sp. GSP14]|uniref:IPT/TIG domain-containing protein n=1 Tax=Flavobacterium sp. GSP14 TaxID=3401734 RepID=UPI003AADC102